jgi:hypothetical protein
MSFGPHICGLRRRIRSERRGPFSSVMRLYSLTDGRLFTAHFLSRRIRGSTMGSDF